MVGGVAATVSVTVRPTCSFLFPSTLIVKLNEAYEKC